jgi:RNase H-fold protein (predicted Holliday junction resolvase)
MILLSIDPGREKCGLAVLEDKGEILDQAVIPTSQFEIEFEKKLKQWNPEIILVGDGTFSKAVKTKIVPFAKKTPVISVDESNSTFLARKLYFKHHPPRGIWKFIPLGLQVPPVPYDDFAAIFLAYRYLEKESKSSKEKQ